MNPDPDIEELEGPFEQIAGAAATDGSDSSDSETITLTIENHIVDYGEITLAKITNIDPLKSILDQGKSLVDQLKNIVVSPITQPDQITQLAGQLQTLSSSVASMKVELSKAKGQTTPAPRELKIQSSKGYYSFEIVAGTPTDVHRKPGNSTDSLGTLSATSGKTDGEGKATIIFTPNGNYGKMTFKVKHGDVESDLEPYENKGEFKEDAQERLQDDLDKVNAAFDIAVITYTTGIGVIAAGMAYLARESAWLEALIAITTLLAIYYVWLTLKNDLEKAKKKLKDKNKPKIDALPSKT